MVSVLTLRGMFILVEMSDSGSKTLGRIISDDVVEGKGNFLWRLNCVWVPRLSLLPKFQSHLDGRDRICSASLSDRRERE
ncbi:hypothetical protein VNO80_04315 [Phaseolus coccineus]|uniref:Uncharacterized protein n=1 Tax=Phaseolus coccineus TaxID=3886 RepID=A0AAN9NTY4_PHACN